MKRTNRSMKSASPCIRSAGNPQAGGQILLALMAALSLSAGAHDSAEASPAASPATAMQAGQEDNWLQAQIRQFRSYPHLHRAYKLMDQNKLAEAAEEMKSYLDIDPRDRSIRMSYLNVLYRLKNMGELLRQTELVLAQDPENVTALLYHALANQVKGNVGVTLSSFRRVYQNKSASKEYRIFAANTAADLGMSKSLFLEALAALTTLASFQDSYFVHYQRGAALDALGNTVESERAYQTALERATKSQEKIQARSALGYLAQKGENYGKARLQGEAILALDPQNIEWLRTLAEIYFREKNYEHAEHLARRSLGISNAPGDRIYLANVLSERRNYTAAIELYKKVVQDSRDDPKLSLPGYLGLGYAYQAVGKQQAARDAFARAAYLKPGSAVTAAPAPAPVGVASASKPPDGGTSLADLLAEYKRQPDAYSAASIGYLYGEKGDHANAAAYFELALQARDFPEWRLCLAEQYAELSNGQKTIRVLAKFIPRNALDWRRISEVHFKIGDSDRAVAAQEKGADTAETLFQLSQRHLEMQRPDKALAALQAVLRLSTTAQLQILAQRQIGYIQSQAGNDLGALEAFQLALAKGDTDLQTGKELGFLYAKLQKYPEAAVQFLRVLDSERNAKNMLAVARAYVATKQRENALRYYQMAQADIQGLDQDERPALYAEMGFLYAELNDFTQAKSFWLKSAQDTPEMQISLAYADEMQDMPQAALLRLEGVRSETLDREHKLELFGNFARILEKTGNLEKSAYYIQQAISLEPSAELHYQFALLSIRQKKNELARTHLEEAVNLAPQNNNYRQQLAYFCKEHGDHACAVKWFEQLLAQPHQSSSLYQDLAYTYAQAGETGKAIARFKKAIDSKSGFDSDTNSEAEVEVEAGTGKGKADSDAGQVYAMRQQVREMERTYQLNLSQSYRANQHQVASNITPGVISGGLVPSQGGIELLYQPPEIGYQNGRILRVFGRDLWSNKRESLSIDSGTYQGGIGIEYKPIGELNAYVSVEKLVKIGSQSENNWLARASWGYSDGYDIKLNESSWRQTIIYADIGYFLQGAKIRSAYAELRHGQVFNFGNATMVTPHFTLAGRSQRPDPYDTAYFEGGAGVAVKHLFNETRYAAARSSAELLLQYRKSVTGQRSGGWVLTAVLQF